MAIKNKKTFEEFLKFSFGQKEASIAVAKTKKEQDDFEKILIGNSFKKTDAIYELLENQRAFFIIEKNIDKDIYDFISQYPTGQVEIFDKNMMKSNMYSPDYKDKSIIMVVMRNNLEKLQKNNFDLLAVTGLAYQS